MIFRCITVAVFALACSLSYAAVTGTSGSVTFTGSPYPAPSDSAAFVFDEQQDVAFVATQPLNFGAILPGTRVNSHYIQFDTIAAQGGIGVGSVTFDGPVIGVATSTANLTADLTPDAAGTSDDYFGLAGSLGAYPSGANPIHRGLGSPDDDLIIVIGSHTLGIDSLEIADNHQVDGIRVFTLVPEPMSAALLGVAGLMLLRRGGHGLPFDRLRTMPRRTASSRA